MKYLRPRGLLAGLHANEPDEAIPELILVGEQWAPVDFVIADHAHEVWEFYLQASGESEWDGPSRLYTVTAGSFFAVGPHVHHHMHDRPHSSHHFLFAVIDLDKVFSRYPPLGEIWRDKTVVFIPRGEALLAPFRQLIREVSLDLPHRTAGLRLALDYVVLEASRLLQKGTTETSLIKSHPAVLRAKELLDHQPNHHWNLTELSKLSGLSSHHLVECFARDIGMSPRQYLLQVRVERAKDLLKQSDVRITDMALELGFSSSQHFASTFKRFTGSTARQFRRRSQVG